MKQLTAAFVRTVTLPGKYGDQHGLILRVTPSGSKQWIWRGTIRGKRRDLGLGGYPYTSLAEARQMAFEYHLLARSGDDPTALRRDTAAPTFAEACEQVIAMHAPSWKDGGRSAGSWRSTLSRFAYPRLGDISVAETTSDDVLAVVAPVWQKRWARVPQRQRARNLQRHNGQTATRERHRRRPPRIPQQLPRLVRRTRRRPGSRRTVPCAHRRRCHRSRLCPIRPPRPTPRHHRSLGRVLDTSGALAAT